MMPSIIRTRTKQVFVIAGILVLGLGAVLFYVFVVLPHRAVTKTKDAALGRESFNAVIAEVGAQVVEANHEAVVEVAVAKTKDEAVRAELVTTLAEPDAPKRRANLLALAQRVRQGG